MKCPNANDNDDLSGSAWWISCANALTESGRQTLKTFCKITEENPARRALQIVQCILQIGTPFGYTFSRLSNLTKLLPLYRICRSFNALNFMSFVFLSAQVIMASVVNSNNNNNNNNNNNKKVSSGKCHPLVFLKQHNFDRLDFHVHWGSLRTFHSVPVLPWWWEKLRKCTNQ